MGRRTKNIRNTAAYGGTAINFDILPEKYVMKRRINRNRIAAFGVPTSPMEALAQDNIYRDTALSQASQVIDPITAGVNQGLDLAGEAIAASVPAEAWNAAGSKMTKGKWKGAYGMPQGQIPVEVEGGETAQLPNGQMIGFNGNLHENGGIDVDLPEGTEIYSQRLTKDGETLAERKLKRERTMDRVRRKQSKRSTDNLYNNTVERLQMIADYQEAQDQAYQDGVRNLVNQIYGEDSGVYPQFNAACGGRVKAAYNIDPPLQPIVKSFSKGTSDSMRKAIEEKLDIYPENNFSDDLVNSFIDNLSLTVHNYNPASVAQIIADESSYNKLSKNGTHLGPFQMSRDTFKEIFGDDWRNVYNQYKNKTRSDENIGKDMADYLIYRYTQFYNKDYFPIDYGQMKMMQFGPSHYKNGRLKGDISKKYNIVQDIKKGKLDKDGNFKDLDEVIKNYNYNFLNPEHNKNVIVPTTNRRIANNYGHKSLLEYVPEYMEGNPVFNTPNYYSDYSTGGRVKAAMGLDGKKKNPFYYQNEDDYLIEDELLPTTTTSNTPSVPIITLDYNKPLEIEYVSDAAKPKPQGKLTKTGKDNTNKSKFNWNNFLSSATLGNLNVLAGNMYQGIAPYLTTLKQREGDMPNVNTFRDYNKDAIRSIKDAMDASARTRDTELADLELSRRSALNEARNQARSVNTLNALGAAMSDYYNQGTEKVYNAYQGNYNKLLAQLSGLQSDRDLKYMTAEDQRNERDTQDRDAFYRNLAKDNAEIGRAIAQSGKDLNAMRLAVYNSNLINQLSEYGIGIDRNGNLYELPKKDQAYGGRVRRTSRIRKCK